MQTDRKNYHNEMIAFSAMFDNYDYDSFEVFQIIIIIIIIYSLDKYFKQWDVKLSDSFNHNKI